MVSDAVMRAAARNKPVVSQDKIDRLREAAKQAKNIEVQIGELEERTADLKYQLNEMFSKTLPDLMDEAGTTSITVAASGNMPAFEATLRPYYSANIVASWPQDRKQTAFDLLEKEFEAGDLIKTEVLLAFRKDERERAISFINTLKERGLEPSVKEGVNGKTLTAWLKSLIEDSGTIPTNEQLEALGASVGRIVRFKEQKA